MMRGIRNAFCFHKVSVIDTFRPIGAGVLMLGLAFMLSGCAGSPKVNVPYTKYPKMSAVDESADIGIKLDSIQAVNQYVNGFKYIADKKDAWATPREFFARGGGDCEDYVFAKRQLILENYLLSAEDTMQVLLVLDKLKNVPHAVLLVNGDVLDNQNKRIVSVDSAAFTRRYQPLTYAY